MVHSDFWRDLAVQFRALDPPAKLRADWNYTVTLSPGNPPQTCATWDVWEGWEPATSLCLDFEALARRGGSAIADQEDPHDSLAIWLDAVKKETAHPGMSNRGLGPGPDGFHESAEVPRVCEASADLCRVLESRALEMERPVRSQSQPRPDAKPADKQVLPASLIVTPTQPVTRKDEPESIADQLRRLREESRLTYEKLAEELRINSRSVERHLAGTATPRIGHIGAYERAFSVALKRKVVISRTPVKRR